MSAGEVLAWVGTITLSVTMIAIAAAIVGSVIKTLSKKD